MSLIEAFLLGLLQGLTEFLPVSSSGHLEIGKVLLGVDAERSLFFTVAVHGATVLSTLVVFRKEIVDLLLGLLKFSWNNETQFVAKLLFSMVPVALVGFFFRDYVEGLFTGNLVLVGAMLLVTASLLLFSTLVKNKPTRPISFTDSLVIGVSQAIAVIPGISRVGATISTGLMLGNNKEEVAKFSFLMVIIPIIGANLLDLFKGEFSASSDISIAPVIAGFVAAFIAGYIACKWMVNLIKRGNLIWFALYCSIVGLLAIASQLF
jgi:undecaprenyl-diphosphatase